MYSEHESSAVAFTVIKEHTKVSHVANCFKKSMTIMNS